MSVIVKNMEMPKCCTECSCCRHDNWNGETAHQCNVSLITFGAEDENWIYDQRPNWCPLAEIPTPHGRLGDLDALYEEISNGNKAYNGIEGYDGEYQHIGDVDDCLDVIKMADTVIEAEGSET